MRFIHTADWHIGMGASHVSVVAESVREARLLTARRILELAEAERCDFVLIAGDLFDSNAVGDELVYRVLHIFEEAAPMPIYILPGNHDLFALGSIYQRKAFLDPPANVHVLSDKAPVYLLDGTAVLLPTPITQKRSEIDQVTNLPETPGAKYRVGVAHGSLCIAGKYQADDHPIALDARAREQLDYLALGHWHSYMEVDRRTIMPGTPEPMEFGDDSGYVVLVELKDADALVEKVQVNTLTWIDHSWELEPTVNMSGARGALEPFLSENTLLRLRLSGSSTSEMDGELQELANWLKPRLLHLELDTSELWPEISGGALQHLAAPHPFLKGMLADLAQLAELADVQSSQVAAGRDGGQTVDKPVDLAESTTMDSATLRRLLNEIDGDPAVIQHGIRTLTRLIREEVNT